METLQYILISTVCLSISYLIYLVVSRSENNFGQLRFFLLGIIALSLLVPLNNFPINVNIPQLTIFNKPLKGNITEQLEIFPENEIVTEVTTTGIIQAENEQTRPHKKLKLPEIIKLTYLLIAAYFLLRIVFHVIKLTSYFQKAKKINNKGATLIYSDKIKQPSSFFKWIFIPKENIFDKNEIEEIIAHEKIHVSQYHSIDNLLIELLSAVMWFNPIVWMIRNSILLVHEYLADEGVLKTGFDKNKYQALLLNHVVEERLISSFSGFNHSLIKKRMIMMTKSKISQQSKSKILILIPLAATLVFGVACVKGQKAGDKEKIITAVAPVKMNVLYLGVDNPVTIASSGYDASDLEVSIDNGRISGSNGNYIINPKKPGNATVSVSNNGDVIQQSVFRIKVIPEPFAKINKKKSGNISKGELLEAGKLTVQMENFDFDIDFKITSFILSATVPNSFTVEEEISKSENFSEAQINLIKSLVKNQKLTVEEIYVLDPGGKKLKIRPLVFMISGE